MVSTRFAVAIHILLLLASARRDCLSTSQVLAASVNTNPVVVRRITGHLARAGLVRVRRGPGGAELTRGAELITLADVWAAVTPRAGTLLPLHAGPNQECRIGREVHAILGRSFARAEGAMLDALAGTTLAALLTTVPEAIAA